MQPDTNTVRRSPSDQAQAAATSDGEPVEIPEHVSPETDALAQETAERIDDVIERDWDDDLHSGFAALLTAKDVERILTEVFEMGYGNTPQLGERNGPLLQYYVGLHPGLRERLTVLRQMAGEHNTELIGRYLDIPVGAADAYQYAMHMAGMSGGEGGEGTRQFVRIRYAENGQVQWTRKYDFMAAGGGAGAAPGAISGDIGWNAFYAPEYWAPEDFVGTMTVVGAGGGFGLGWEVEGATLDGNGTHAPISADIGGFMWTSPEIGFSGFTGRLEPWMGTPIPAPGPGHGVLPPPPPYVQRPEVRDQITIHFATASASLDETATRELADFVGRSKDVFEGGLFTLQLVGYASRTGSTAHNQQLSEERWRAVLATIESDALLGRPIDPSHLATKAVGEEEAPHEGRDKDDDSASDRVVEVSLVGRRTVPVNEP